MKPVLLALALVLSACGAAVDSACDRAALDGITSQGDQAAQDLIAACPGLPQDLGAALAGELGDAPAGWDCSVPVQRADAAPAGAVEAFEACDLGGVVGVPDPVRFAFGDGEPVAAVLAGRWLRGAGYPPADATRIARSIVGVLPEDASPVSLPAAGGGPLAEEVVAVAVLAPDSLRVDGGPAEDHLGTWAGQVVSVLPIAGTPGASLGRVVSALRGKVDRLELVALDGDGQVAATTVHLASADPGVGLAGAIDVHLHPDGVLLEHGTPIRHVQPVSAGGLSVAVKTLLSDPVPGRRLRIVPHGVTVDVIVRTAASLAPLGPVDLTPGDAECGPAPAGMVCVPGAVAAQGQAHRVISPFLIDVNKASLADYESCVEAGACRRTERRGSGPETLTELSWEEALRYCVWSGKTLPTEWQWEHAASAAVLADALAGPSEWTLSGFVEDCGEPCQGIDPIGPCGGAEECAAAPTRAVRGGAGHPATDRRGAAPAAQAHGVRCVSAWPAEDFVSKPVLGELGEPTAAQLAAFAGSTEDPIELKPLCDGVGGQAQLDCKDPVTYIIGNEPRAHLFMEHLEGLGGGYIGVAADQNYSQAAVAKTEWLWLMDYDPKVVSVHRMNGVFIKASATPAEFVDWYRPARRREAQAFVEEQLGDDELTQLALRNLRVWGDRLHEHYTRELGPPEGREGIDGRFVPAGRADFGWLRNEPHYQHIRRLWQLGRVRAVKGDMLGDKGMQGIGAAAREMGVPIRVYYTSNAPYAWGGMMTEAYRRNVRSLPMDEHSILVQTLGSRTGFGQRTYWHHSLVRGTILQERLGHPGFDHVSKIVYDRAYGGDADLTVVGLPAMGGE